MISLSANSIFIQTGPKAKFGHKQSARGKFGRPRHVVAAQVESQAWQYKPAIATGVLAAITGAALLCAPLPAQAVSGGGGMSDSLAYGDFTGQDLRKYKLTKANARKTNFTNANLSGVSLFGVLAKDAVFVGTNLSMADLESGYFEGVDFSNAILEGAFVNNAQFIDIKIDGSDWTDVVLRKDIQKYLCSIASGTNPVTGVDTRDSLLCP